MIFRTKEDITGIIGNIIAGPGGERYAADERSVHSDEGYHYEVGYKNGRSIYVIFQKKSEQHLVSLIEAESLRGLIGIGKWKSTIALNPDREGALIQQILDDRTKSLEFIYTPAENEVYTRKLFCSHQKGRRQLIIFDPFWRPDLAALESKDLFS